MIQQGPINHSLRKMTMCTISQTLTDAERAEALAVVADVRRTAVFHFACMWLEPMAERKTRTPRVDVESACIMLTACFPGVEISVDCMIVALDASGFTVEQRGHRLLTNLRDRTMFKAMRGMRCFDAGMTEGPPGHWTPNYTPPDARWTERLARIDAEIAARKQR